MLRLIEDLNEKSYNPVSFVIAESDQTSESFFKSSAHTSKWRNQRFITIPRSREVGQSWITTIWTTFLSFLFAFSIVWNKSPQLIISNGPGTAVPIIFAALILRMLHLLTCKVIFVESFCRTQSLSLSGKILYPFVDKFVVHWESLIEKYPKAEYIGTIL